MLCTIEADLSRVPIPLLPPPNSTGQESFYRADYDIVLLFGMTELNAQIAWEEEVSDLYHMLFHPTDIYRLIFYACYLGERETVSF